MTLNLFPYSPRMLSCYQTHDDGYKPDRRLGKPVTIPMLLADIFLCKAESSGTLVQIQVGCPCSPSCKDNQSCSWRILSDMPEHIHVALYLKLISSGVTNWSTSPCHMRPYHCSAWYAQSGYWIILMNIMIIPVVHKHFSTFARCSFNLCRLPKLQFFLWSTGIG